MAKDDPDTYRRVRLVRIGAHVLMDLLTHGTPALRIVRDGLPLDAVCVGVHLDAERYYNCVILTVESRQFDRVDEGANIPWHPETLFTAAPAPESVHAD